MSAKSATYSLEQDFLWFQENQVQFQRQNPMGGHIVIKDKEILGVWATRNEALTNGLNQYGNVPFLVRSVFDQNVASVNYSTNPTY